MKLLQLFILVFLFSSCKQKTNVRNSTIEKPKKETQHDKVQITPIARELVEFVGVTNTSETDIEKLFLVKEIDKAGNITTIDFEKGIASYKRAINSMQTETPLIFEIVESDKVILTTVGKGYMGAIWAKILVDKSSKKILKVQFDHKGESEGYGAEFTNASFENQFTNAKISFISTTFSLKQDEKLILEGNQEIDGISGATITSKASIIMINQGLQKYQEYFR